MKYQSLAFVVILSLSGVAIASEDAGWGYEGETGPDRWAALTDAYSACSGRQQSPIDLDPNRTVEAFSPDVDLHWAAFTPEVVDTGHTIQVNTGGAGGYSMLDGKRYDLAQFHFHHQSEHTVLGVYMPMEVHFVHVAEDGALLVIGNFIVAGAASNVLGAVWEQIAADDQHAQEQAQGNEESQAAEPSETESTSEIDPTTLVSDDDDSFRYRGSLTTPPCTEIVTWIVKEEAVTASQDQIDAFAALYPNNSRPAQPLNRRFVLQID
ncbi:MAG: carbonic anhydrase family protein [Pseudomonadota bacterium]